MATPHVEPGSRPANPSTYYAELERRAYERGDFDRPAPSRRKVLGLFAAAPIAAIPLPALAAGSGEWDSALAAYRAARLAVDRGCEAMFDESMDALNKATDRLLVIPAPTMAALAEKIEIFRAEDGCHHDDAERFLNIAVVDARRLAIA